MPNRMRAVWSMLPAVIALAGITGCAGDVTGPANNPRICPGFDAPAQTVEITPAAGSDTLGPGSLIRWNAGAVTTTRQLNVTPLIIGGSPAAGIRVTPSVSFSQPVFLRLSYAACAEPADESRRLYIVRRDSERDDWEEVRGSQHLRSTRAVEVEIDGFSEYAIAD